MGPKLPAEIKQAKKVTFYTYDNYVLQRDNKTLYDLIFSSGNWESDPYVVRDSFKQLFTSYDRTSSDVQAMWAHGQDIVRIAFTELWLRQINQYKSI